MEQIKTSTSCPAEIKAGDENADYTGAYVSFTSTETRWHNIFLTPKYDLGEYAEYDLAEVWLYADANDGTEVGFSFFNDVNYNFRFPSDTWTKITLDMEDFIAKMGENNAIFLPFNTNNPSSTNHASLTELRLGGVFAKYAVEYSVEAEGLNIAPRRGAGGGFAHRGERPQRPACVQSDRYQRRTGNSAGFFGEQRVRLYAVGGELRI